VIASTLSSAMGLLTSALERLSSSNSLKYSQSGRSSIQRVYVAFAANSDLCLSFLRQCVDYGEKVVSWRLPSIASLHVVASNDLRERTMRLRSEMRNASGENATSVQGLSLHQPTRFWLSLTRWEGSRKFKATYDKALTLERKTTSGMNTLLEKLSSWVMVADSRGLPADVPPDVLTLEQVCELSYVWAEARDSMHAALLALIGKPAPQLFYRSALKRPRAVMRRWMMNLVRIS
jgi:hypothetical protein